MKKLTKRERQRLERALDALADFEGHITETLGTDYSALSKVCEALRALSDDETTEPGGTE